MATIQGNSPKRVLVLVFTPMMRVEVAVTPSGFTTPQPGYIELKILFPLFWTRMQRYSIFIEEGRAPSKSPH
jgi:hypothetical protein